jgi:hypothetical protein
MAGADGLGERYTVEVTGPRVEGGPYFVAFRPKAAARPLGPGQPTDEYPIVPIAAVDVSDDELRVSWLPEPEDPEVPLDVFEDEARRQVRGLVGA